MRSIKICMIGAFSVGKTSLVNQFVSSIFNDKYLTTIGVKISKKQLSVLDNDIQLLLWDIEGVDAFTELKTTYLRGAAGIILAIDGTREATFQEAIKLKTQAHHFLTDDTPLITLINKSDLKPQWQIDTTMIKKMHNEGWHPYETSAKNGDNVEYAFIQLVEKILQ